MSLASDKSIIVQQKFILFFNCKFSEFEKEPLLNFLKILCFLVYKELKLDEFQREIWGSEIALEKL